jgi:hypothetical protein
MSWYQKYKESQVKPFDPGEYVMRASQECLSCGEIKKVNEKTKTCEDCEENQTEEKSE